MLADLAFTQPIELADVKEVHGRIVAELAKHEDPPRTRVEVYHRIRDVVVTAREAIKGRDEITYNRVLEVEKT